MFILSHIVATIITSIITFSLYYFIHRHINRKKIQLIETVGATKIDSLKTLEDVEDESRKYLHFLLNYYNATNVELYYLHYVYNKDKKNNMFKFSIIANAGNILTSEQLKSKKNIKLDLIHNIFENTLTHKNYPCTKNIFNTDTNMYSNIFKNSDKLV